MHVPRQIYGEENVILAQNVGSYLRDFRVSTETKATFEMLTWNIDSNFGASSLAYIPCQCTEKYSTRSLLQ